ncbi:MAG: PAS domain-containing protein [Phenylobacterium sp.]|uniref:hybrid sensor histidine kinase/response regulator n=1 Tax=Phenylobacterium sp. TaxID=1871053 RepID=UPI00391A9034
MPSSDWPLRLAPRRAPPLLHALAVTVLALAAAVGVRLALLGEGRSLALSAATYFPALILAAYFGGYRWGLAALAAALGLGLAAPAAFSVGQGPEQNLLFVVCGLIAVLAAALLRSALIGLSQSRKALAEARDALERSEARARLAQEVGGFGFWDWNVIANEGVWSPGLYRIYGIAPDPSLKPRDLVARVHPDDRELARQVNITAVTEGRMAPAEYRIVRPDGEVRWLLSRAEMTRNAEGRVARAVGVNIDITEQRLAGQKLRESEARFHALADSAPVLLWVSRTDGGREFANRAYVDFLGVSFEEALAFDWRLRLHPDDLERILREQVEGESSGRQFTLEARYRRADGEWRWIRSVSQPRHAPGGEFAGFIGIGYDITDARRAEEGLTRINELLAERVQAALAERDHAEAALRRAQKLEAVGQLTGGVAHDFNNLLTVIIGALDLMQRHPEDAARRTRMIEAAQGAARRGERLTQQLLAFSRRQALRPELVCVDELLRESEPLLRRAVGEAVALTVAPAAPGAVVRIDPSQFEAAVLNMVVNARDAVASGGAIRIETVRQALDAGQVEDLAAGDYLCIVVHDTGVGMAPEVIARVFEPFFTTKEVGKGTGLGLSQVYGFARQSGGGVGIDSAPGKGASVRLFLPCAEAAAAEPQPQPEPAPPRAAAPAPPAPALAVLLVEDDLEVGDLVVAMLQELGHRVIRAGYVDEALPILRSDQAVDLLLTDLVMPGGRNGVDLAREAVELRPGLPVILSSGYTGDALSAADGAPWPLLRKPYSADALAQTIAAALRRSAHAA